MFATLKYCLYCNFQSYVNHKIFQAQVLGIVKYNSCPNFSTFFSKTEAKLSSTPFLISNFETTITITSDFFTQSFVKEVKLYTA